MIPTIEAAKYSSRVSITKSKEAGDIHVKTSTLHCSVHFLHTLLLEPNYCHEVSLLPPVDQLIATHYHSMLTYEHL